MSVIVLERKCDLGGVDQILVLLTVRGVTMGETVVRFDEVYGAGCRRTR